MGVCVSPLILLYKISPQSHSRIISPWLIHHYYHLILMEHPCPFFLIPRVKEKTETLLKVWPKDPNTCTFPHIAKIFMWGQLQGVVKILGLAGSRFKWGHAGRPSENDISAKQMQMWYFKQDFTATVCCPVTTTKVCTLQFSVCWWRESQKQQL